MKAGATALGIVLLGAVVLMGTRVGAPARFVSWPVVAFTALAAAVAVAGAWTGARKPSLLAVGLLPALVVSYFLPALPFPLVAVFVLGVGVAAVVAGGVASGMAAGIGTLMVVFIGLQGPAVECGESSVSSNSGPWWIEAPNSSVGSGTTAADGSSRGTIQVGDHQYTYVCRDGGLRSFNRV